jgi:hypothetical protein
MTTPVLDSVPKSAMNPTQTATGEVESHVFQEEDAAGQGEGHSQQNVKRFFRGVVGHDRASQR